MNLKHLKIAIFCINGFDVDHRSIFASTLKNHQNQNSEDGEQV